MVISSEQMDNYFIPFVAEDEICYEDVNHLPLQTSIETNLYFITMNVERAHGLL